jgi:hypothetical protein
MFEAIILILKLTKIQEAITMSIALFSHVGFSSTYGMTQTTVFVYGTVTLRKSFWSQKSM